MLIHSHSGLVPASMCDMPPLLQQTSLEYRVHCHELSERILFVLFVCLRERVASIPAGLELAEDDLDLLVLLLLPPYRHCVSPHPVHVVLRIKPRPSCLASTLQLCPQSRILFHRSRAEGDPKEKTVI